MMSRSFVLAGILALCASSLYTQPKIKVLPEPMFDIGDYYQGQKAEHLLTVKNVGTDTLKIADVKAQCGCTATMMAEKVLAPGQEGKLSITFDTHSYTGKVTKQVWITSNDTSSPKTTIQFTANVTQVLSFSPTYLGFNDIKADSTYTKTITITNPSQKQSVKILTASSKSEMLKVEIMKNQLMPGEQTQLQAVFHPTKSGTFTGDIELTTDHPLMPTFVIKYSAWVNRK
jgi:hypothetical protein